MKYQVLFFLKKKEMKKVFMNAICCSRDWRFKGDDAFLPEKCFFLNYILSALDILNTDISKYPFISKNKKSDTFLIFSYILTSVFSNY